MADPTSAAVLRRRSSPEAPARVPFAGTSAGETLVRHRERQEQHEQQAQAHAGEEQEKHAAREASKYKGLKGNTPGSRRRDIDWHRLLKQQNEPQDQQGSRLQLERAPSSAGGPTCHSPPVTREAETGGYTLWLGQAVSPGTSVFVSLLQQPSWP